MLEGAGELQIDGRDAQALKAGDQFQVPPATPHGLKNGGAPMKLAIIYTVEKGKPLASPA